MPRSSRYVVVVFVINEGDTVRRQLERHGRPSTRRSISSSPTAAAPDGSLDLAVARTWGVRALLTEDGPGQAAGADADGVRLGAGARATTGVITIDGNGKDGFDAIPEFLRLLDDGYDHVQGSRFIPGGRAINTPLLPLDRGSAAIHAPLISLAARTPPHRHHQRLPRLQPPGCSRTTRIAVFREVFSSYELHYHLAIESSRDRRFRADRDPVTRAYPGTWAVPDEDQRRCEATWRVLGISSPARSPDAIGRGDDRPIALVGWTGFVGSNLAARALVRCPRPAHADRDRCASAASATSCSAPLGPRMAGERGPGGGSVAHRAAARAARDVPGRSPHGDLDSRCLSRSASRRRID